MLRMLPVNTFSDNYVWLILGDADGAENSAAPPTANRPVVVVDPGDARPVLDTITRMSFAPVAVLVTHHHYDHVGGVNEIRRRYSIPVYGPKKGDAPGVTHRLCEGELLTLPMARFRVLEVPGHTLDHIAFFGEDVLFCGDTLFAGGCGRLFEGTAAQMYNSLTKLMQLPDRTRIYCAHEYTAANLKFALLVEPDNDKLQERYAHTLSLRAQDTPTVPSPLLLEKQTNPFLRCRVPGVVAAAQRFAQRELKTEADVFETLRYWKDTAG